MKIYYLFCITCLLSIAALPTAQVKAGLAGPVFDLVLAGPSEIVAEAGSPVVIELTGQLLTSENPTMNGAQGWQVAAAATGAAITDVTTQGTAGADVNDDPPGLRNTGSESSQLTTGAGNEGAVSTVTLSFTMPITLPPAGTEDIVKFTLEGIAPSAGETEVWSASFVDGLVSTGSLKTTYVTWSGITLIPSLGSYEVRVIGVPEPGMLSLALLGFGSLLAYRHQYRLRANH